MGITQDKEIGKETKGTFGLSELTLRERQLVEIIERRAEAREAERDVNTAQRASEIVLDTLDESLIDILFDRIAIYVGKGVLRKGLWLVGIVATATFVWFSTWLAAKGFLK